jgi:hypothetical protein
MMIGNTPAAGLADGRALAEGDAPALLQAAAANATPATSRQIQAAENREVMALG